MDQLVNLVNDALADLKAVDPIMLDVRGKTAITDYMFVASGNSNRHVKSIADSVIDKAKAAGIRPLGVEGEQAGEWILVDLGDAVVHVMLPKVRDLYRLERIWGVEGDGDADQEHEIRSKLGR